MMRFVIVFVVALLGFSTATAGEFDRHVRFISEQLNLSDAKTKEIEAVIAKREPEILNARNRRAGEGKGAEFKRLVAVVHRDLSTVLTPDQMKQLERLAAQRGKYQVGS